MTIIKNTGKIKEITLQETKKVKRGKLTETYIRKIPYGNEIIGLRFNNTKGREISDIAFVLWAPQESSFTDQQRQEFRRGQV